MSESRSAASSHEDDEWNITYEHVDPNDPLIAAPRWRDALSEILTICEDANRPWQRLDVAAVARRALGEKS